MRTKALWLASILGVSAVADGEKPLKLADIVPHEIVPADGLVLAMVGAPQCGASQRFRTTFGNIELPSSVKRVYVERSPESLLKYYPTPMFIFFRHGTPVDFHVGVVGPQNSFAPSANAAIFQMLMVRNGLVTGPEWQLADNKLSESGPYDYRAVKFARAAAYDFANKSFVRTTFSQVRLPEADFTGASFNHTIMAHVDLEGATLSDVQAGSIIWINSICPDGTRSNENFDTCVGHVGKRTKNDTTREPNLTK